MHRIRVDLDGPPQTMLATLYAKALDADAPRSILHDRYAKAAVERIEYDWAATTIDARRAPSVAVRSAHFDNWTRQFLAVHDEAVVLHAGCGLDARVYRLDPGAGVRWFDVDYPEVIRLRERVYPARDNYRMLPASVTDPSWLADIPDDRPVLFLAEGLTMYLTKDDGLALLCRVVDRFSSGELQFDAFNTLGIRSQWINSVVRRSGSKLHWGIDEPSDIVAAVPGVRVLVWESVFDSDTFEMVSPAVRWLGRAMAAVPALRNMSQYHRYAFGPPQVGKPRARGGVAIKGLSPDAEGGRRMSHKEVLEPNAGHPITITPAQERVQVRVNGDLIADTAAALELREATIPVVYYIPLADVAQDRLTRTETVSYCPFKGDASYYAVTTSAGDTVEDVVWTYEQPYPAVAEIAGHVAFYPNKADISVGA